MQPYNVHEMPVQASQFHIGFAVCMFIGKWRQNALRKEQFVRIEQREDINFKSQIRI